MNFKNMVVYLLEDEVDFSDLDNQLSMRPLTPCLPTQAKSTGWLPPDSTGAMVVQQGEFRLIALGTEEKVLPKAVVKAELDRWAEAFEDRLGYKPGRKIKKQAEEDITLELLPRAFVQRSVMHALIDTKRGRIIVQSSSPKKADELTEHLRDAMQSLPIVPLTLSNPTVMTQWLLDGFVLGSFSLGSGCVLEGRDDDRPLVKFQRHPMEKEKLEMHIASGMLATQVDLETDNDDTFTLDENASIKALHINELDDSEEIRDADADFVLFTGVVTKIVDWIESLGEVK